MRWREFCFHLVHWWTMTKLLHRCINRSLWSLHLLVRASLILTSCMVVLVGKSELAWLLMHIEWLVMWLARLSERTHTWT